MAGLEGMSEDDENLERNASMKTWLVLGLFFFFLIYLTVLLPGNITQTNEVFFCKGIQAD